MENSRPDFVISDDLLSPEEENHGIYVPQSVNSNLLNNSEATIRGTASARSLDNILLDASPMEESIDLGSESVMMESVIITSEPGLDDETNQQSNTQVPVIKDDFSSEIHDDAPADSDGMGLSAPVKQVHFTDTENIDSGINADQAEVEPMLSEKQTSLVAEEMESVETTSTVSATQELSAAGVEILTELHDVRHLDITDAVEVGFVEEKGIHSTASSRSLSKFFLDNVDSAGCTDTEGKNFFDSFTATVDDTLPSPQTFEQPGSLSPATCYTGTLSSPLPPVNLSSPLATAVVNSPSRRISDTNSPAFPFQSGVTREESISSTVSDVDPFSTGIFSNDSNRRHDAWIPSAATRQVLMSVIASALGTSGGSLPSHPLTKPYVLVEQSLGDPVRDMVQRFMGEQEAAKRLVLNADRVPQDEIGLQQLIKADCLRAAVDLTCRLLTQCGQGSNCQNQPAKHTPFSLQLWFCRLSLLVKLRLFSSADAEMEQFGDLDSPDLYHEYYTQPSGPIRQGSMVPFDMRLLHAELPQYLPGRTNDTLDRLHRLLTVIRQIQSNLANGLAEDGSMLELNSESRQASQDLWSSREVKVLYAIGNCLLNLKDYVAALEVYRTLLVKDVPKKAVLHSSIGRIYLQLGDSKKASQYFDLADSFESSGDKSDANKLMHSGLLQLCNDNYGSAYEVFKKLVESEPTNVIAVNNLAVCSLYLGRLKEAIQLLENLVYSDPGHHLQEGVLLNLSTLYELESSRAMIKKQSLLSLVCQYRGNGFNVGCLKLG